MKMQRVLWQISMVLLLSVPAWANGVMIKIDERGQRPDENETVTMLLGEENLKIEAKSPTTHNVVIFMGKESRMLVADLLKRTYMEITQADLQQIKSMHQQAMGQNEQMMKNMSPEIQARMKEAMEQLKNLPPEQQEMAKKYMNLPTVTPEEPLKTTYKLIDAGATYNNWRCRKYEGYRADQKVEEVLATDFSELGVSKSDFQVFRRMSEFFESLGDMAAKVAPKFNIGSEEWEKEQGYRGIPVKTVTFTGGKPASTTVVREVLKQQFSGEEFRLPDGLILEKPFEKMQQGMH